MVNPNAIIRPPGTPLLLAVQDDQLQAHMQTYPFLDGPDENLNRACLAAVRSNLQTRVYEISKEPVALKRFLPSEAVLARLDVLFQAAKIPPNEKSRLIDDYAWKIQFIPEATHKALAVGHHFGHELLFIRAAAPSAEIYAIDWHERTYLNIVDLVKAKVFHGNILYVLEKFDLDFDLVFSNHVLEHMYDPDRAVRILANRLATNGVFLCGLPLDGSINDAFESHWEHRTADTRRLRRVDMGYLDPGHPWKTSPSDVVATFEKAGLKAVEVYSRPNHLTRGNVEFSQKQLMQYRRRGIRLNRLIFGPLRILLHGVFGDSCPPILLKVLFALERRAWFGSNRFKNAQSYEVVAVAHKS